MDIGAMLKMASMGQAAGNSIMPRPAMARPPLPGALAAPPAVPADGAMAPTIGPGTPDPAAAPPAAPGMPQMGGLMGLLQGGAPGGIMGVLQSLMPKKDPNMPPAGPLQQAGMLGVPDASGGPLKITPY